jgi:glyoxylase-like metal-dependent hydrolase (beta-lactamase superfamily II)
MTQGEPAMPSTKVDTGLNYSVIEPAKFKLDGGAMYGIIPKPLWNKVHPADDLNRVDLALRLWLIQSEERVVVVDTGIGDYHDEKFQRNFDVRSPRGPIEQALNSINLTCHDVTDLVISHLHFDHVGGIGTKDEQGHWQPVFPKAHCHVHQEHLEYAHNATDRDRGSFHTQNFDPILEIYRQAGRLHTYKGKEGELFDLGSEALKFKCSFGHTPWLMHPYTSEYIYLADLIPTGNHIHVPWVMGYDISPGVTTEDKKEFLAFITQNKLKAIFEHDPQNWGAAIGEVKPGRYGALESFKAQDQLVYPIN